MLAQVLQLSHNAMEVMPLGLLSLPALTYLDLSYNRLTALPFWIGSSKMQQLKRLNLVRLSAALWSCQIATQPLVCECGINLLQESDSLKLD